MGSSSGVRITVGVMVGALWLMSCSGGDNEVTSSPAPAEIVQLPAPVATADSVIEPSPVTTRSCPSSAAAVPESAVALGAVDGEDFELFSLTSPVAGESWEFDGRTVPSSASVLVAALDGQILSSVELLGYAGELLGAVDMDRDGRAEVAVSVGGATAHYAWLVHMVDCELSAVLDAGSGEPAELLVAVTSNSCAPTGCAVANVCAFGSEATTIEHSLVEPVTPSPDPSTASDFSVRVTRTSYSLAGGQLVAGPPTSEVHPSLAATGIDVARSNWRLECP